MIRYALKVDESARAVRKAEGNAINTDDHPILEFGFAKNLGRFGLFQLSDLVDLVKARGESRPVTRGAPLDWALVDELLLPVHDVVELYADVGVDHQRLHGTEGDHDRERRGRRVAAAVRRTGGGREGCHRPLRHVVRRGRREGAAGQGRVDCHARNASSAVAGP